MDRFDAMQAFARVVETGSFTKAAETLHMSKTSVTQLVQQLEARLRVRLLNRTTRKVNVTADGAAYYERVLRVLADVDDAETSLSDASTSPRGRLRVDVPSPLARMILIPALSAFFARYPDIQLDLGVSDRMVDIFGDNVDCVVRGGELTDQSLVARHIADLQLGVYAAPGYLKLAGTPTHPKELEDTHHRIVGFLEPDKGLTIHTIDCQTLADFADDDSVWQDLQWTPQAEQDAVASARLRATIRNAPGVLGQVATIIGEAGGNILNLSMAHRQQDFFDVDIDVEVEDARHATMIIAALRANPSVDTVDRARG